MTEHPDTRPVIADPSTWGDGPVRAVGEPPRADTPNALLVTPFFFGYEMVMAEAIAATGPRVLVLDERPSNSVLGRGLARVRPEVMSFKIERHYSAAARQLAAVALDVMVIVKGEIVPRSFIARMRAAHPRMKIVYYAYDTMRADENYFSFSDLVDRSFSFDPVDVLRRTDLTYRPLFYAPAFHAGPSHAERPHDATMIGTVNPERYARSVLVQGTGVSMRTHLYTQSRAYLGLRSMVDPQYRQIDRSTVTTTKLGLADVADAFRSSRVVVDVQKAGQNGLTMRTLEALATGAHLLTWNQTVTREPFFDPRRVQVVEDDSPESVSAALRRLLLVEHDGGPPATGFVGYSARDWARDILEG